jgi:hypothetical protein
MLALAGFLPRLAKNATPDHSLAAAYPKRSVVAQIVVKLPKQSVLKKPYKHDIERKRNMEAPKK